MGANKKQVQALNAMKFRPTDSGELISITLMQRTRAGEHEFWDANLETCSILTYERVVPFHGAHGGE